MKTAVMEKSREQVNVHSRLTVVSSTPTEPMGLACGLSPIDHIMGSHTGHIIFYYRTSPFLPKGRFSMDLDNFRVSLAELLSEYPRITGRLVRGHDGHGNWLVKYNDAGVRMFKAEVGVTVDEWLGFADESDERNLTVWEDMPDGDPTSWSPFQIQISEFVGGGLAVGLSFTHLLADPTAATQFYKAWTDAERGETIGNNPPVFNLPLLDSRPAPATTNGNTCTTTKYLQRHSKLVPTDPPMKMATSTFKFSNKMIEKLLSEIADKCPNATPFDYLTTLFWSRIIKLKTPASPSPIQSISLCIDARKLLDVPIPNKFFGNAISFSQLSLENEMLTGDSGLAEAVESVHRHVTGIKKDDILSTVDWLETCRNELNGMYPKPVQMYGPSLTCVSLEHLMIPKDEPKGEFESLVYEAKFRNNEKPVHVSYHVGKVEGEGLIVVGPSAEGGVARTVTVTLPAEEIGKLCRDPVIIEMEPAMILSGRRE
ncbi:protein ECERIFERUM 2-like [Cynara cardunculus var. scolymus]|uniref:Chloramphenicol acetyltransferase-like domain-containing protein n=1 Tax=Cynara cardunculus var. scolymus TaxID=59895 RepID=A0A124SEB0_CYNCS|nr:protein ECERIFERUM 2-like [Cynara cardunculus var. scolymus]KVH99522.1 Chloramphenicol acetyltransferase-like domain-containing protein [Cynara cardunculus var. scolymus]